MCSKSKVLRSYISISGSNLAIIDLLRSMPNVPFDFMLFNCNYLYCYQTINPVYLQMATQPGMQPNMLTMQSQSHNPFMVRFLSSKSCHVGSNERAVFEFSVSNVLNSLKYLINLIVSDELDVEAVIYTVKHQFPTIIDCYSVTADTI